MVLLITNYLSLNHQLIPITITKVAYELQKNGKITNYIVVEMVMTWF